MDQQKFRRDADVLTLSCLERAVGVVTPHNSQPSTLLVLQRTARMLRLLADIHGGLSPCTERDLYYRHVLLFHNQRAVHCSIESLCHHLEQASTSLLPAPPIGSSSSSSTEPAAASVHTSSATYTRELLGISAAPRATITGHVSLLLDDQSIVDVGRHGLDGLPITAAMAQRFASIRRNISSPEEEGSNALALVVVEKESTMRSLWPTYISQRARERHSHDDGDVDDGRQYVFLCTRGYPCTASRMFLQALHRASPLMPLLALVDGDPHGLRILTTIAAAPTPAKKTKQTACRGTAPSGSNSVFVAAALPIAYVGVRPSTAPTPSCLPLAASDTVVIEGLVRRLTEGSKISYCGSDVWATSARAMVQELRWMQRTGLKCELQALDTSELLLAIDQFAVVI